jgi:hypothetical protein
LSATPDEKEFNWCSVVPTVFRNEPFGKNVEGLSYCRDDSCITKIVFKWRGAKG